MQHAEYCARYFCYEAISLIDKACGAKVKNGYAYKFVKEKYEKNWSGREDLNLRPLVPNQIQALIEIYKLFVLPSNCR